MQTKANIGDVYGRLTIKEILPIRYKGGSVQVLCQCSCGNMKTTNMKHLRMGATKSCGCLAKETAGQLNSLPKGIAGRNELYHKYKISAKERGINFCLSKEEFTDLTTKNCHYCGQEPKNIWQKGRYNGDYVWNGIDRKDSNLDYTINNTVSCCSICNRAKGTVSYIEFINWISRIKTLNVGHNMKELKEVEYCV